MSLYGPVEGIQLQNLLVTTAYIVLRRDFTTGILQMMHYKALKEYVSNEFYLLFQTTLAIDGRSLYRYHR